MTLVVKNLLFTLVVPGTVGVYVPWLLARGRPPAAGVRLATAVALIALGAAIYAWCARDFAALGRGTPAPVDAPRTLVVRGPYRHTRNPMYLGVLAVILGWAIFFRASALALYGAVVAALFHAFVVLYEEPHLRKKFGAEYADYCARVPRWLPRLGPGSGAGP